MFEPAHKSLPPVDYVSMIRSLYAEPRVMLLGALASAFAAGLAYLDSHNLALFWIGVAFVAVGVGRAADMRQFALTTIADDDVATARRWEGRATVGAIAIATLYGVWSFYSFVFVNTPFAEMAALSVSVSVLVGVTGRNFAIDRLMSLQVALIGGGLAAGMLLDGAVPTILLSLVLFAYLASIRKVSANIRAILIRAVHGRLEASRLATTLDTALATMHHALCLLDVNGSILVLNQQAEDLFKQFTAGPWAGRHMSDVVREAVEAGNIPARSADQLLCIISKRENGKVVIPLDGAFVEVTFSERQESLVLLFEDITERVQAEERINFMARYDMLTKLPNRGSFSEQVENDLKQRRELRPEDMTMLMIVDLDDFKHVNDVAGHLVGDQLLVEVADRLRQVLGTRSLVARLGGDEFIVYRSGDINEDEARHDAESVNDAFAAPFLILGERLSINVSTGLVLSADPEDDLNTLMTRADLALYRAKGNGKAQSQIFHDEIDSTYRHRQRLKAELRTSLDAGLLNLVYQPLVDLKTQRVVTCEALARWTHPTLGPIPPSLFIPIAEEAGLISQITRWVLKTATAECAHWPDDISVAVNISARDFGNDDVTAMVDSALEFSGLPPERLEVEITETALIEERDKAVTILSALEARGIGIALDDFGTGYSSLSYLRALPFTKLKVDRSFVMDVTSSDKALRLLTNVVQLGKDLDLTVVAEGVETDEQLDLIRGHTGIDQVQGYLFGRPMPSADLAELIARFSGRSAADEPIRKHG